MASCSVLLFFVFLRLVSLSESCYDKFTIDDETALNMTALVRLAKGSSLEEILNCTILKNQELLLLKNVTLACFEDDGLSALKKCQNITGTDTIHVLHLRCLFAKVRKIDYSDANLNSVFGDCQNFGSEIKTIMHLWNISANDGTSTGTTSISPKTTSPTSSPTTPSTPSSTTTSTSTRNTTLTIFSQTSSMSLQKTTSTRSPTTKLTPPPTTKLTPPQKITSTRSPTTKLTPPQKITSTRSPTTKLTPPQKITSTRSPTTKLTPPQKTTSTKSQITTSRSSLTTQSTAKEKTKLSSTATPTNLPLSVACACNSASHAGQITDLASQTPGTPFTWLIAFVLVLLILSVVGNILQWFNSNWQKQRLNVKQKPEDAECISLNPDTTAAQKSPEETLTYSNETVH